MGQPLIRSTVVDRIAIVTLNHPEKRNALSRAMLEQLRDELVHIGENREIAVVILRAEGPVFSSGHDLRELTNGNEVEYSALFSLCTDVMEAIRHLPQPVIAQVHGLATAAGCQLVASCDLVVAAEEASFATPGVKIGLFCTTPGVALVRAVLPKKAMEMLLTGTSISAQEAERAGLVNRVVPKEKLAEQTMALARQICDASRSILALGKRAFYDQLPLDYAGAYAQAQRIMVANALATQAQEGIRAFLEKRVPKWAD
jgi:enoyl-CoA hydratase/carnithine racemase